MRIVSCNIFNRISSIAYPSDVVHRRVVAAILSHDDEPVADDGDRWKVQGNGGGRCSANVQVVVCCENGVWASNIDISPVDRLAAPQPRVAVDTK